MNKALFGQAMVKLLGGVVLVSALLFVPAGTLYWIQGWLLMGILFLSMPLVLGSVISVVIMLAYIPIIATRIRNEEQVLEEGMEGYREYKQRVR